MFLKCVIFYVHNTVFLSGCVNHNFVLLNYQNECLLLTSAVSYALLWCMLGKHKILIVLASGFNKDLNNCIGSVIKSSVIRLDIKLQ